MKTMFLALSLLLAAGAARAHLNDEAPPLPTVSATGSYAEQQDLTLITFTPLPTRLEIEGQHLAGATVQFGSQFGFPLYGSDVQVSANGTHLSVLAPTQGSGEVPVVIHTQAGMAYAGVYDFLMQTPKPLVHLTALNVTAGRDGDQAELRFVGDLNYSPVAQEVIDVPEVWFGDVQARAVRLQGDRLNVTVPPGHGQVPVTLRCPLERCAMLTVTEALPFTYR